MGLTSIEWTDHSWPLANGCRRISPGCEKCYAERLISTRLRKTPKYEGLATFGPNGPRWTGKSRFWVKDLAMPLKLKKPSRIFVADMGDLFYEGVSDEHIAAVFGVMAAARCHTFQVLTKRPGRALEWFQWVQQAAAGRYVGPAIAEHAACWFERDGDRPTADILFGSANEAAGRPWPLTNVHFGVSVENQEYSDKRIPILLQIPAAVRWVSAEPLLGPLDLAPYLGDAFNRSRLQWVVVGGESGPGARPYHLEWARRIIRDCQGVLVPVFHKQVGSNPVDGFDRLFVELKNQFENSKGGDPSEWPDHLRVREFPR